MNTQLKKGALELCVLSQLVSAARYASNGPARKYYQLTQKGREYQQAMLQEWEQFQTAVNRLVKG